MRFLASGSGALMRGMLTPILLEMIDASGKTLLDLGCGEGYYTRLFRQRGAQAAVGIDISETLLAEARKQDPPGRYFLLDFNAQSFPGEERFDVILANMVLMNFQDLKSSFAKLAGLMKLGGQLTVVIANPFYAYPVGQWKRSWFGKLRLVVGNYFAPQARDFSFPESELKFPHYHHLLSEYVNYAMDAGFTLHELREPAIPSELSKKYRGVLLAKQLTAVPIFQILNFKYGQK